MTMTLVSTVTVESGGAASISFTSIPQTGTDLLVVLSLDTTAGSFPISMYPTVNGADTGNYRGLYGDGSSAASHNDAYGSRLFVNTSTTTANTFSNMSFYFTNYTSTTNKSVSIDSVTENNATSSYLQIQAGVYTSSTGITSLTFAPQASLVQYSTASLYTITKGSGGATVS